GADRRDLVERLQLLEVLIDRRIRNTAHHASEAQVVHREESHVEEDKGQEEMNLADRLVQHHPEHFREPEIDRTEDREDTSAEEDVMEVRHDEVGVVHKEVDRSG